MYVFSKFVNKTSFRIVRDSSVLDRRKTTFNADYLKTKQFSKKGYPNWIPQIKLHRTNINKLFEINCIKQTKNPAFPY